MSLTTRTPMRPCGRRFATEDAAMHSKRALAGGMAAAECMLPGCGGWHLWAVVAGPVQRKRSAPKATGFAPAVRLAVRARAGDGDPEDAVAECCGIWLGLHGGEVQHRVARGEGGTSRPEANMIANAALMCRPHHRQAEDRDPEMYERGFWLWQGEHPELVPLVMHTADGGFTRWLTADGGYSEFAPGSEAA